MKSALFLSLSLATLVTSPVWAATFVVDGANPQASDAGAGTREAPLKSVSAAAARAVAGDTVLVRPGVYRESVTLTNSGAPGRPIVFVSEEPRAAWLCGSDVVTNWQSAGHGVWVTDVPSIVSNKWALPHGERGGEWVYVDGAPLEYAEERERQLPGTFHLDFDGRLYVAPEEGRDIRSLTVEYAHRAGLFWTDRSLDDIQIVGFTLRHNACWFRGRPALRMQGRRWRVENNHVLWTSYTPGIVTAASRDMVVRGNLVEWCGSQGLGGSQNIRMLVESNTVRYCNWRRDDPSSTAAGGSKWFETFDSRVRNNLFEFNYGSGVWFDWGNAYNVIEGNVCRDNSVWGLFVEVDWSELFRDNISYNNTMGIVIAESPGSYATRNICFNNDYGIMLRGQYTRSSGAGADAEVRARRETRLDAIPDLDPQERDRILAGWMIYHAAQSKFMSNNSLLWENLLFDNVTALWEARDYATPSPLDPWVNNFSDHNLFYLPTNRVGAWSAPVLMTHRTGACASLAEWQRVSGRDAASLALASHPRSATNLPAWVEAKRALWDVPLRRREEIRAMGLVEGPAACAARGRWLRSPTAERVPLGDPQVKAFVLEVEGERTLMLWTSHEMARRYVRLALDQPEIDVENGYLQRTRRVLPAGALDLVVTWQPTYLRGLTGAVREAPASALNVAPFNPPDLPVAVTAVFPNSGGAALPLEARFSVSDGFAVEPAQVTRSLAAGETARIEVQLIPDGTMRRGAGTVRVDATLGAEPISRLSLFSVGEAGGVIPRRAGVIRVDGRLDDWSAVQEGAPPLALVGDRNQFARGDADAWQGPADLGCRLYAACDTQALYVAVAVTDDRIVALPSPAKPWDADCVELFVDGRSGDMQWQPSPTEGCYQIAVAPGCEAAAPNVVTWSQSAPRPLPGLQVAVATNAAGYTVELLIPLTLRNFPAGDWSAGRPVKMSLLLYDKDDPGASGTKHIFGWSFSPEAANFRDTSGWRTLVLE